MLLYQHWPNKDNISVLGHVSYHYCTKVFVFNILEPILVRVGCVVRITTAHLVPTYIFIVTTVTLTFTFRKRVSGYRHKNVFE